MSDRTVAIYAGSFDPVTHGHLDLMKRAVKLFDEVIVAVGIHPTRKPLFSVEERVSLLKQTTQQLETLSVDSFSGLLINFCQARGARIMVRGLRHGLDFEYELQIAQANADMAPEIDTVFLPTSIKYGFITASLVREIASHGGDVHRYAPEAVCKALGHKFT